MSREPYAYEMLFRSEDMHGASFEGNGEITRDKAKAEADGRAMVEVFGYDEWALLELYAEPPELGELVAALQDSNAMLEELTRSEENSEDGITWTVGAIDAQLADNRTALARYEDKGGTDE